MHPFQARIRMEREIVALVNQLIPQDCEPLSGFSHAAINRWRLTGPLKAKPDESVKELLDQMKAFSLKLRLASASSHRGPSPNLGVESQLLDEEMSSLLRSLAETLQSG